MPNAIGIRRITAAFHRLGFELIYDADNLLVYIDPDTPIQPVLLDLGRDTIPPMDLQRALEYAGINPDVFFAELESM